MPTSGARSLRCANDSTGTVSSPLRHLPQSHRQYPHLPSLPSLSQQTPYLGVGTPPDPPHRATLVDNSSFSVDNRAGLGITRPIEPLLSSQRKGQAAEQPPTPGNISGSPLVSTTDSGQHIPPIAPAGPVASEANHHIYGCLASERPFSPLSTSLLLRLQK
jgi:hypothetical protein